MRKDKNDVGKFEIISTYYIKIGKMLYINLNILTILKYHGTEVSNQGGISMEKHVKKIFVGLIMFIMLLILENSSVVFAANQEGKLQYQAHVADIGWQSKKGNAETAGTTGKSKQMEALKIWLTDDKGNSMIQYQAHVQNIGWQSWKKSGEIAGTTGQSKRVEAIKINLTGTYAKKYDIWYRVHVHGKGWLGWTKNGLTAGSTGLAIRVEAIQIKLVSKGTSVSTGGSAVLTKPSLSYRAHVANTGWMNKVSEGATAGTTGQSRRLEGLMISLNDFNGKNGIQYRAHVSNVGWQGWKTSSQLSGTTGQSRAIEAVQIKLSDSLSEFFDIYYRLHVKDRGWLGWAKNGAAAGTTGGSLQAEAIQVKLVVKNEAFNTNGQAYYDLSNGTSSISAESVNRQKAVDYMNQMATVKWTPSKTFLHWSGGRYWYAGVVYSGIPYTQKARTCDLEKFKRYLSGNRYVGPSGQSTYLGNDCSSAVSMAYRKVRSTFPITWTGGMFPKESYMKCVGNYRAGNSANARTICTSNGISTMKKAYACLQKGDIVLSNNHVMMVTARYGDYVTVTHQTTYSPSLQSTWRVNEKYTFNTLYNNGYIPVTLSGWT